MWLVCPLGERKMLEFIVGTLALLVGAVVVVALVVALPILLVGGLLKLLFGLILLPRTESHP